MALKDFLQQINDEVKTITASDFDVQVIETKIVPRTDDKDITYENLDTKLKKCKLIETCVLYIDIRKSTELSLSHYPKTLTKLYSSFVKSMVKSARYYGGHVRNIIGDRVMVVFDTDNCFTNAINTAILMHTVATRIINKHFKNNEVKCGIGIDYGKMLVSKVGTIRQGIDNPEYKALVWLGKPANIASKLTDIANKVHKDRSPYVNIGTYLPLFDKWVYSQTSYTDFIDNMDKFINGLQYPLDNNFFVFKNGGFKSCYRNSPDVTTKEILMTEIVYNEFCKANPNDKSVLNGWWQKQNISIPEYNGTIYGGGVYFTDIDEVK